jgi:capsular exopolysaccharide synthesis family protein
MLEPVSFSKGQDIEPPKDFKEIFLKYFYFWPWFVIGVFIALASSYFYINSAAVIYTTNARIKIINEKSIPESFMEVSIVFDKPKINIENEIALFKSYHLTEEVVKALDLNINYSQEGIINKNTIKNTPFKVEYKFNKDSIKATLNFKITIEEAGYKIKKEGTEEVIYTNNFWFDSDNESFPIQISPKNNFNITELKKETYFISINPIKTTTKKYVNKIKVTSDDEKTNFLTLSLQGYNSIQNELILNKLITVYDEDGIRDQQDISKRTFSFIDERLEYLLSELEVIEKNKKEYKTSNKISYRRNDANIAINERLSKDNTLFDIEGQLLLLEDIKSLIFSDNSPELKLLPSNIGLTNSNINSLIDNFNNSVLEVYKFKQSAGENNPKLKLLKATIAEVKRNIISSTDGYAQQLKTSLKQIKKAQIITNNTFAEIPKKENILRTIERKQELKENLYMMLLRKREEAAIKFGITTSNVKVIDFGFTDPLPNTSNKEIYLIALASGLLVPFGIIYLLFLLNSKIFESKDITAVTKEIPILYEIPLFKNEPLNNLTEKAHQQEVFRTLMYNTLFIKPKATEESGISILVTSSISGEGKTFIAVNLAKSLAEKGKKVVLLGGDLRNPKIHKFLNLEKPKKGIVNYVLDSKLDIHEITTSFSEDLSSFDIISSGIAQSIPTTILANPRFETLMSKLKNKYDYVVIDSAPTQLVSDTLIFAASADITLLVTRFRYTDKKLINYSLKLAKERKLKNMAYVVNGMKRSSHAYAYGYGYGYRGAQEKKKWYHF